MSPSTAAQITEHIVRHIGAPLDMCLSEIIGDLQIQVVPAESGRCYQTLVTTGMSDHPMKSPSDAEDNRNVELFMYLPEDWPLAREAWEQPQFYWPIEWMRVIAHHPELSPKFLASENTYGNSPAEPLAPNTKLSCLMVLADPTDFGSLHLTDGRTVRFYQLIPLYEEERRLKERCGTRALIELFQEHGISQVVHPDRINVAIQSGSTHDTAT